MSLGACSRRSATDVAPGSPAYHEPERSGLHVRPFLVACATYLAAGVTVVRFPADSSMPLDHASTDMENLHHDPEYAG
jgi:hypothetical protein